MIHRTGFTLVETLIAIAILLLAIVGPLVIGSNSLTTALYAKDQITAYYLAQEGVEYIRSLRDNNTLTSNSSWDEGIVKNGVSVCTKDNPCGLDVQAVFNGGPTLVPCNSITDCPVKFDPNFGIGIYRQPGTNDNGRLTPTNFTRTIVIEPISPGEDKITVNVSWNTQNIQSPRNFEIIEDIFDWQIGGDNGSRT